MKVPKTSANGQEEDEVLSLCQISYPSLQMRRRMQGVVCGCLQGPGPARQDGLSRACLPDAGDLKLAALAASSSLASSSNNQNTLNLNSSRHTTTISQNQQLKPQPKIPTTSTHNVRRRPRKRKHNQSRHHRFKRHQPTAATAKARRTTRGGR